MVAAGAGQGLCAAAESESSSYTKKGSGDLFHSNVILDHLYVQLSSTVVNFVFLSQ